MAHELPLITIIIPARPGQVEVPAVAAARALEYPKERLEIVIARGRQPAVQRNEAVRQARGAWIYFLDDDARPARRNLLDAASTLNDPKVWMLGGPNLCPPDAPLIEQVFAVVLSSLLAFGPSRARYEPVGKVRATSEKELILCNLMARREALLATGGFDESLYPNEENALMDDFIARGGQLIYDPGFIAHRRPRPNLAAFAKMLFRYGRGRAEQFRSHPTLGSTLNFVPPLFCVYLASLIFTGLLLPRLLNLALIPLGFYVLILLVHVLALTAGRWGWKALLAAPLIMLTHCLYGVGFWCGLFTRLARPSTDKPVPVSLETVPS